MLVLDTCALIFDALAPDRLTARARRIIEKAGGSGDLAISDVTLWEVAMLVARRRLDPGTDARAFLRLALASRSVQVMPITIEIADRAAILDMHGDPADRLIVATAIEHNARLLTTDRGIEEARLVETIR